MELWIQSIVAGCAVIMTLITIFRFNDKLNKIEALIQDALNKIVIGVKINGDNGEKNKMFSGLFLNQDISKNLNKKKIKKNWITFKQRSYIMTRYVGITNNPKEREETWRTERPWLTNWKIIAEKLTYEEAQTEENKYIRAGYNGNPGGQPAPGRVYSVYIYDY